MAFFRISSGGSSASPLSIEDFTVKGNYSNSSGSDCGTGTLVYTGTATKNGSMVATYTKDSGTSCKIKINSTTTTLTSGTATTLSFNSGDTIEITMTSSAYGASTRTGKLNLQWS